MSSPASKFTRLLPAASPAVAGHRPLGIALAVAACFAGGAVHAQGVGAQAIAGTAVVTQQGKVQTVTTTNAAGTSHSAINWQSFSIPSGYTTNFNQPNAQSTSINRVLGNNPSAIFGTLSSNGKIVLINPSGIAVGKGAVVDTNGFTASALAMNPADAIAGRMRFGDGTQTGGTVSADGRIYSRNGDVVLIAPNVSVGEHAVIQTPQGAAILAAGAKAQITGRGLEGIALEVKAPANQAVNLGRIEGDAVGIFAGTLRHSGSIQATGVTAQGGKVVLKASDVVIVSGSVAAKMAGGAGGAIQLLGKKVGVLDGALLDASGRTGGGTVLVGGDYKGANPNIPNAEVTYVASGATIKANATESGDGGKVIVWSDDTTRVYGSIEAKGGPAGGNGGFVETSGKRYLDANGVRVDTTAPRGQTGMWLLDPADLRVVHAPPPPGPPPGNENIESSGGGVNFSPSPGASTATINDATINSALSTSNVTINTSNSGGEGAGNITFDASDAAGGAITIMANGGKTFTANADNNIYFDGGETTFQRTGTSGRFTVALNANGNLVQTRGAPPAAPAPSGSPAPAPVAPSVRLRDGVDVVLNVGTTWVNLGDLIGSGSGATNKVSGGLGFRNDTGNVSVDVDSTLTFSRLEQTGGTVVGDGNITVTDSFRQTGGQFGIGGVATLSQSSGNGDMIIGGALMQADAGITISAASGSNVLMSAPLETLGGDIVITTNGGRVDGYLGSYSNMSTSPLDDGNGGSISITTGGGSVHVGNLFTSSSSFGTSSGSVYIATNSSGAAASVITGDINTGTFFGDSGGSVTITTNVGDISTGMINTSATIGGAGGSVTLSTQNGNIGVDGTIDTRGTFSGGGDVTITAYGSGTKGYVTVGDIITSGGDTGDGGIVVTFAPNSAGNVTITADQDVVVGSITATGNSGSAGASGGNVSIASNGGSITFNSINTSGGNGSAGSGGGAGSIGLNAATTIASGGEGSGNLTANGGSGSDGGGGGGYVEVVAGGQITLGAVSAIGGSGVTMGGGGGGYVSIYSYAGGLTFGSIDVSGGTGNSGGNGGFLNVDVDQSISSSGSVMANGGAGTGGSGGSGGTISLNSGNGGITVASITANGGDGLAGGGGGGDIMLDADQSISVGSITASGGAVTGSTGSGGGGGYISLYSDSGGVTVTSITANGGNGIDWGGSGGSVIVEAEGVVDISSLTVNGGTGSGGSGGGGGYVSLYSYSGGISVGTVTALGGSGFINGGGGGGVTLESSGGSIAFTSIDVSGGSGTAGSGGSGGTIDIYSVSLGIGSGNLTANGGTGGSLGGNGGSIWLEAGGSVEVGTISANGGNGVSVGVGAGGSGGSVRARAYGFSATEIVARGGDAAAGSGSMGGNGGSVSISTYGGGIGIAGMGEGMPAIDVGGGAGGSSQSSSFGGGDGGEGGSVQLYANYGGGLEVNGISAVGGAGGSYTGLESSLGSGRGGMGGWVNVYSAGAITLAAPGEGMPAVNTSGGAGGISNYYAGSGGDAGAISITTDSGTMSLGVLMAQGGTGGASSGEGYPGGWGGEGGAVTVRGNYGNLALSMVEIYTNGGAGGAPGFEGTQGEGGYGGNIDISAAEGNLSLSGILDSRPGAGGSGAPTSGTISLSAGNTLDFSGDTELRVNLPGLSQIDQSYVSLGAGFGGIRQSGGAVHGFGAEAVNLHLDSSGAVLLPDPNNVIGYIEGTVGNANLFVASLQGVGFNGVTAGLDIGLINDFGSLDISGDVTSSASISLTAADTLRLNGNVTANGTFVSLTMDNLYVGMTSSEGVPQVTASSVVELNTYTASRRIAVGDPVGAPGTELVLDDERPFHAPTVRIGRSFVYNLTPEGAVGTETYNAGGITLAGNDLIELNSDVQTLSLFTDGFIGQAAGGEGTQGRVKVPNLQASGGEGVELYDNQVDTVAGMAGGSGFVFTNAQTLRIGRADGVVGISAAPSIYVGASGNLIVSADVRGGSGATRLDATGEVVFDAAYYSGGSVTLGGAGGAILTPNSASVGSGTVRFDSGITTFDQNVATSAVVEVEEEAKLDVLANRTFTFGGGYNSGWVHLGGSADGSNAAVLNGEGLPFVNDGLLSGNGVMYFSTLRNSGVVSPGNSPGTMYLYGDYDQTRDGVLAIDVMGPPNSPPGTGFDRFYIYGTRYLDGTLAVTTDSPSPTRNGAYDITPGEGMQVGNFALVSAPGYTGRYQPLAAPPPPPSGSPAPAGRSFLILGPPTGGQENQQVIRDQENVLEKFLALLLRDEADRRKANDDVVLQCSR